MLVKYWMNRDVIKVDVDDSMQEATTLMKEHNPTLLAVTNSGKLVGVITDRDIKRASASDATTLSVHELMYLLAKIKCKDIMIDHPVTVPPDFTLEETADLLLSNNISAAPVVDYQGKILGTISQRELFVALVSMSGLPNRGMQFAVMVEDKPGSIKEVTDAIRTCGGRLVSILTSYDRAPAGFRNVYIRAHSIDRKRMEQLKDEIGKKARLLYVVDHLENKREEYAESSRVA